MAWFIDALKGIFDGLTVSWTVKSSMTGGERRVNGAPVDTLLLNRSIFTDKSTIGDMFIDGVWRCFSLEPTIRKQDGVKLAMPQGKYELVMYDSPHFKKRVPLLLKVPGHDSIEIHPGNCPADTHDCILPGLGKDVDWVSDSEKAWEALVARIEEKLKAGRYYIGVSGGGQDA